jgi:hypothetical protein
MNNPSKNHPLVFGNNLMLLNKFFNVLYAYWIRMKQQEQYIQQLKDKATGLIKYFKNKQ